MKERKTLDGQDSTLQFFKRHNTEDRRCCGR